MGDPLYVGEGRGSVSMNWNFLGKKDVTETQITM